MKSSQLPKPTGFCELRPLGGKHDSDLTVHHILAKHVTRGSLKLRQASERPELLAWVCSTCHNTRVAESKEARRFLLRARARAYGEDHMRRLVERLPARVRFRWEEWA